MDFLKFEPLSGAQPARVIARHADGVFIAMEIDSPQPAIGVWDSATGQAVWTQEGALAFAWNHDGSQIILLNQPPHQIQRLLPIASSMFSTDGFGPRIRVSAEAIFIFVCRGNPGRTTSGLRQGPSSP
jgi:hypothetical protein